MGVQHLGRGAITAFLLLADSGHMSDIRMDSRSSGRRSGLTDWQRAGIRQMVKEKQHMNELMGHGKVSQDRQNDLIAAMGEGLGIRFDEKEVVGAYERFDSMYFQSDLVDRGSGYAVKAGPQMSLSASLPIRNFSPGKDVVEMRAAVNHGVATLIRPGVTQVGVSGYSVGSQDTMAETFATQIQIPWTAAFYGATSDIDPLTQNMASAKETLDRLREKLIVNGFLGTQLPSLTSVSLPRVNVTTDISLSGTTIGTCYSLLSNAMDSLADANEDVGTLGDVAWVSTDVLRALRGKNNLDAGGDSTGAEMFDANEFYYSEAKNAAAIGRFFASRGITRVIASPSLNDFDGDTTVGAILIGHSSLTQSGLRQTLGLAPTPVRTAVELTGDSTLVAMKLAGLELPSTEMWGLILVKVA